MIFLVLFLSRKKEQTNVLKRKLRSERSRVYHLIGRSPVAAISRTLLSLPETQPKECEALWVLVLSATSSRRSRIEM
jgi:hypothetical protein